MAEGTRYRINTPKVAFEVFEDEVVMVNFDNGAYYSINGTGSRLIGLLGRGVAEEGLAGHMEALYGCDRTTAEGDVRAFLDALRQEDLVTPLGADETHPETAVSPEDAVGGPYEAPTVSKYSDMEDLIMLDPIHEVDESGWPNPKPDDGPQ